MNNEPMRLAIQNINDLMQESEAPNEAIDDMVDDGVRGIMARRKPVTKPTSNTKDESPLNYIANYVRFIREKAGVQ
ncbi:MAG TPA: hypothetical protein V6D20_00705 [Candidatus Obscuribacterales bacterium]